MSGMVEELLRREENKALLDGLEEASARVERAREALADIERQEADAFRAKEYVRQLQSREAEVRFPVTFMPVCLINQSIITMACDAHSCQLIRTRSIY